MAKYILFAGLCVVLCAIPAMCQFQDMSKIESDENLSKNDASDFQFGQMVWKRDASSSRRVIDWNRASCSRYCIQKTGDDGNDPINRINVIWKILDDSRVRFTVEPSNKRETFGSAIEEKDFLWETTRIFDKTNIFSDNNPKCELYIEISCETHKLNVSTYALENEFLNHDVKKLVTMNLTEGYTEREFKVVEFTEELRIFALGKLSQAILEIPIASQAGDSTDARTPSPTLSLSRTSDGKGLRLDARNPPSGLWRLKLLGVENSKYSFIIVAASTKAIANNSIVNVFMNTTSKTEDVANAILSTPEYPVYLKIDDGNAGGQAIKSNDQQIGELLIHEQSVDEPEMLEFSTSKNSFVRREAGILDGRKFSKNISREINLDAEMMESQVDDKIILGRTADESSVEMAKIVENSELEELSRFAGEIQTKTKKTVVDLSPDAQLIARPGFHDVVFTVKNNQPLEIRHTLRGRSTQFPLVAILPSNSLWIRSGETLQVAIRIQVPNTQDPSPSIVTLSVGGNENLEAAEKSTYVYVQGSSQTTDNDKPSIDYSFNDNCNGKLNRDRCNRSLWSVEVTVKDSDSGLKTVTSLPTGIEPLTEFIAGTKNSVTFYYVSTCCYQTVDIKATDVQGNIHTRTVDVTEWDNLSQGEIAAIVVGALFILLLIILIILLIVYCVRTRKSHDLSYSQRYGSRTPASAERTNF